MVNAVGAGRTAAQAQMLDTCDVKRPTGHMTQDETTGREIPEYETLYSSPCKVASRVSKGDTLARYVTIGGVERPVIDGGIHLPMSALDIGISYVITLTALGPVTDPRLLGQSFRVESVPSKSYATARRLDVVEVDL